MSLLEDITTNYNNPEFLRDLYRGGTDEDYEDKTNYAIDISSKTRVIKLIDGRISYSNDKEKINEVYIPDTSYLLPFKEVERTIKSRQKIFRKTLQNKVNIFPYMVDDFINSGDLRKFTFGLDEDSKNRLNEWLEVGGLKEVENFAEIYKNMGSGNKIDKEGLVLLQSLNPVIQVRNGYEFNGVFHNLDRIGKIEIPAEVFAFEAEFSFSSDNYVKINDSNNYVGKYKEGILTLKDPILIIQDIPKKDQEISRKNFWKRVFSMMWYGFLINQEVEDLPDNFKELKTKDRLSNLNLMKVAFYGKVKDKRFENLEEVLV